MQCLSLFKMYLKINLISLTCDVILNILQYFEISTRYPSFNLIYFVSHYFKSSAKMLKSSLVPSVRRKRARWSDFNKIVSNTLICLRLSLTWIREIITRIFKIIFNRKYIEYSLMHIIWKVCNSSATRFLRESVLRKGPWVHKKPNLR